MEIDNVPVTCNKQTGFLSLRGDQLVFYAGGAPWTAGDSPTIAVPLHDVETQLQNTRTGGTGKFLLRIKRRSVETPVTLAFTDPANAEQHRNQCRDALVPVIAENRARRETSKESGLDESETAIRRRVLQANPEIFRLHKALVQSGMIGEDEFWATRKALLLTESLAASQQRGAGSELLQEIRPQMAENQDVKVVLTASKIKAIFVQNPSVERAYVDLVPDRLSQVEFWKRYFSSRFFQRRGAADSGAAARESAPEAGAGDGADASEDLFERYAAQMGQAEDESAARVPDHVLLPFLDLSRDAVADDRGAGVRPDATMRPGANRQAVALIRRFNALSEMVLKNTVESRISPQARASLVEHGEPLPVQTSVAPGGGLERPSAPPADAELAAMLALDDLAPVARPQPLPLPVADPSRIFQAATVDSLEAASPVAPATSSWNARTKLVAREHSALPAPATLVAGAAAATLQRLTAELAVGPASGPAGLFLPQHNAANAAGAPAPTSALPPAVLLHASQLAENANELLRHFWAARSHSAQSESLRGKAERLGGALAASRDALDEYVGTIARHGGTAAAAASEMEQLLSSVRGAVAHALSLAVVS